MDDELSDQDGGLYRIVYDSVTLLPFGEAGESELRSLIATAQASNARYGITGVLRYDGAYFLQVLEGPRAAVEATMARILRDPRHADVRITAQGPVTLRDFAAWNMALITDQKVAQAQERNPHLLDVHPYRAAEVVASFRGVLAPDGD
mgnify:CR=1 FL=1